MQMDGDASSNIEDRRARADWGGGGFGWAASAGRAPIPLGGGLFRGGFG